MKLPYLRKIGLFLLIFIMQIFLVQAAYFGMDISESGSVLDYYGEYFIVNVKGNFTMSNHYDIPLYGIKIPFNPSTLSVIDAGKKDMIRGNSIRIPVLHPNESSTLEYRILGIATEDPFEGIYHGNMSALRDIIDNVSISAYSDMHITLRKGKLGAMTSNRPLEVKVTNPTSLEYIVNSMRIIKTRDENVNDEEYHIDIDDKTVLYGDEEWSKRLSDTNTGLKEDDVYWFVVDLNPQNFNITFEERSNVLLMDEGNITEYPKEGTVVPDVEEAIGGDKVPESRVFVRKTIEPKKVFPGDILNVTLIVTNLEQHSKIITLTDYIPDGFEFITSSSDIMKSDDEMQWVVDVNKDTSKLIHYSLKFVDNSSVGMTYLPAAKAVYDTFEVLSPQVPLIRRFVPEKKIYLQKSMKHLSSDNIKVSIILRNMGEADINDLVLKEYMPKDSMFQDITIQPEDKGLWEIPVIKRNEEWVVSYQTDNHRNIDELPSLYGVGDVYVMKTLVKENIVSQYVLVPGINVIEFVGLTVVILFPVVFFYLMSMKKKLRLEE